MKTALPVGVKLWTAGVLSLWLAACAGQGAEKEKAGTLQERARREAADCRREARREVPPQHAESQGGANALAPSPFAGDAALGQAYKDCLRRKGLSDRH